MGNAAKTRTRRKRRQEKARIRHGKKAKPRHALIAGRTGHVHSKKTPKKFKGATVIAYRMLIAGGIISFVPVEEKKSE